MEDLLKQRKNILKLVTVCKECKRESPQKKATCCKMLFEAKNPLGIDWFKSRDRWTR